MFRLFGGRKKSKDQVKERLKMVLSYDRAKLTPGRMEDLKAELMEVLSKYFPTEESGYDVTLEQQGDHMVMTANLPLES